MKHKTFFISIALIAMLALVSCAKEAKQEAAEAGVDATPTALVTLDVQGMTCAGCESNVKLAVKKLEGVKDVEASFDASEAKITVNPEKANEQEIIDAINKIGYAAKKKD